MIIIYSFTNCSNRKYAELFSDDKNLVLRADQKYHSLLIQGLSDNGVDVMANSSLPINRTVTKNLIINEKDEAEGNVYYHYYKTLNLPIFRQLTVFCSGFFNVLKSKGKDSFLICDYQNTANAYGSLLAAKIKGIKSTVIVMDLPDFLSENRFVQKIYSGTFKLADSFVLLTEQMSGVVNTKNKPYVVVEGIADYNIKPIDSSERFEYMDGRKIVIYAGNIAKLYGIQNLTEGFIMAEIPNAELWIYGDGDYKDELQLICGKYDNVKYKGIRPNDEVVYAEQRAALLVNPRPTGPSYTKYSFPSKNMEYMASGTPVLTTDLPGMPQEYKSYVYLIDKEKESSECIAEVIKSVLGIPKEERYLKGSNAQKYVLAEKSSRVQSEKTVDLMRGL